MERSQASKILRLAPDFMLVPSLCPFSAYASSVLFPFLSFISLGLQGSPCASPESMFISFLCPFFAYTFSVFFLFLSFYSFSSLQGPTCASLVHHRRANHAHYTWGLLTQKLNYLSGLHASHMCYSSTCTFSSPLYASI